ncbi:hypothetical protein SAMN02799624_02539 [Paenibacillus sp. UNC496MF]|uniref:DUF6483 family protein n=1 Tax=Paenibacillus sp. UNC496MF TaxID=1502753 RepID=UPI0008F2970D|nr:DUF6483 family protein [Paenibacillus sp. UNC496MF]SFI89409.1 hypothetical protein SAMN02799624_02539 [Paenibacillus sp. UNC496MF]
MFQRDFFMRMIQQMGEAAGVIMGLRQQRKHEEALLVIDDLLDRQFRMNGKLIRQLSDADLVRMMTTNGVVETANLSGVALLMKEEAAILSELGRTDQAYPIELKAFHLFMRLALLDAPAMLRTPSEEAEELAGRLGEYELPGATKLLMLEWYEGDRRYDEAENMLHELLEDGALTRAEAVDFYSRLLLLPDESLEAGGLPRDEVLDGLGRIKQDTEKV